MSGEAIKWQVSDDWVAIGWHWSANPPRSIGNQGSAIMGNHGQSWAIMGNHGQSWAMTGHQRAITHSERLLRRLDRKAIQSHSWAHLIAGELRRGAPDFMALARRRRGRA